MLKDSQKQIFKAHTDRVASGMQRFLAGKRIAGLPAPVATVEKVGDKRVVTDVRGNQIAMKEPQMKLAFNKALAVHQRALALSSVRINRGHTATAILGGLKNGEKLTFQNVASAKAAINKRYNQAITPRTKI
jgi:hypothetical protein